MAQDKEFDLYFELFKRNLDDRRFVVLTALTTVLGFAVTLVQLHLNKKPIVTMNPYDWRMAILFTIFFIVSWVFYFVVVSMMTRRIRVLADKLTKYTSVQNDSVKELYDISLFCGVSRASLVPFGFSLILYLIVVLPVLTMFS